MPQAASDLTATKFRYYFGTLEVLLTTDNTDKPFSFWFDPKLHPEIHEDVKVYLEKYKPRITGKPGCVRKIDRRWQSN